MVVAAVPPSAASNAAYLAKRLRARFPGRKIAIALLGTRGNFERITERLKGAGASDVLSSFTDAVSQARPAPEVR